ncbi:ligand-dependent nuclear receptor-interacting factor 1-like isoform X3 [Cygnus olor]|uniref:ligand-dependent nuclear receptor-interacting factor 1-like isoform X3 n=1 Tax=Cygnus olor TaxID=8869 RepID=UPI001ADE204F|nr:ligand-dependent nuclear receptor-interacting factor 1-like isoform X3 [Cygnus olor]
MMPGTSTTSALVLQYQQMKSEEYFSTRSFNTLENVGMTSADRGKFSSKVFNTQSNETSAKELSLGRCPLLTHTDREDKAPVSGICEHLKVTEESEAEILKYDLEIPPEAKVLSVPLSYFPPAMQQLMSARTKNDPEVREATEIPTVTYIWPVIKMEEASKPFWDNFPKSLIPTSTNLARPCSSPDTVTEDVKSSQITPVKQFAGEKLVSKTARSYPLIVKSSNSVVSGILRSLTDIKYKDYKNVLPLSSVSPTEEKMKIPILRENAVMIHNGKVYLLAIHDITTKASDTLLSRQCVAKQNIKCLPTLATHQDEISKVTHFFSHRMTTMSQPKQCCPLSGKGQQALLNKTDFPSEEDLQPRNWKEVRKEEDNELRKEFGILKDVRVHLTRISTSELTKDSDKASTFKWKFLSKAAFPSKEGLQKTRGKEACQEEDNELKKVFGIIEDGKSLFQEDSNLI